MKEPASRARIFRPVATSHNSTSPLEMLLAASVAPSGLNAIELTPVPALKEPASRARIFRPVATSHNSTESWSSSLQSVARTVPSGLNATA